MIARYVAVDEEDRGLIWARLYLEAETREDAAVIEKIEKSSQFVFTHKSGEFPQVGIFIPLKEIPKD